MQLHLFPDFTPRSAMSAEIIRLPTRAWAPQHWRSIVAPIVTGMQARKSEKGRAAYWKREVVGIEQALRGSGATEDEITAELHRFRQAVIAEMARRGLVDRQGPGAA
jgi:hypothetical protein